MRNFEKTRAVKSSVWFSSDISFIQVKGPSAKFDWQRVGLDHLLKDDDLLTIILRKS